MKLILQIFLSIIILLNFSQKAFSQCNQYPTDAYINLVAEYGIDNTGATDVTAILNQALHDYALTGMTLYLPNLYSSTSCLPNFRRRK